VADRVTFAKHAAGAARVVLCKIIEYEREEHEMQIVDYAKVDIQGLALAALEGMAAALRKTHPELSKEQAFSKVYQDPSNAELQRAERGGAIQKFYPPVASLEPAVSYGNSNDTGLAALKKLAAELRQRLPFLTVEQAFAKVYADPDNHELAERERAESRARLYGGAQVVA
jgi:hypothetical protein